MLNQHYKSQWVQRDNLESTTKRCGSIPPVTTMNINKIFNELQLINEFEANFKITPQSKARREELTNKLQSLMDNNIN